MKVLLCIDNLGAGGAQRQIVTLASGLKKQGYEVELFTYFPQNFFEHQLVKEGIKVNSISKTNKLGMNVVLYLRSLLIKGKYDVAVSYLKTPNLYLALAALISGAKTKIITSERTRTDLNTRGVTLKLHYWAHKRADCIVFNSNHERENWTGKFTELRAKSQTIYNGIDLMRFRPQGTPYAGKQRSILGIGSVGPDKNILCLIEALYLLKLRNFFVNVTWYGQHEVTIPKFADYLERVKRAIEEYGLSSQWKWEKPIPNIETTFCNYDFLVLPSVIEGLPNVACESLAAGLPVLISNGLDHPVLVEDRKRGLLFDPEDPGDLADKILLFYELDDERVKDMRHNARAFAEKELGIDIFISKYDQLFRKVLNPVS